jgi:hypothetical protein
MNLRNFLESKGYKMWKEEDDEYFHKEYYQIRLDNKKGWDSGVPLCNCNDAFRLNIKLHQNTKSFHDGSKFSDSYEMEIIGENTDGEWVDTKIYGLTDDQILPKIHIYEDKLIRMWKEFNK